MTITLSSPVFFRNGKEGVSSVVGVESTYNRVARYGFTSPDTGASSVRLSFSGMWPGNGTQPTDFRFFIGTDPTSHTGAGASHACHGLVTADSGGTNFTGSADVLLLPGTQYYLFVFPNTTDFGWYYWEGSGAMTLSGGSYSIPTVSSQTVELGQRLTVFTNPHSPQFTHSLSYELGTATGVIAENVEGSASWTPPLSLANQLPNTHKGLCRIYCTTYQNGVPLGEKQSVTLTLTVPEDITPTVSATWQDKTSASDLFGTPVQLVSALTVTVTGQGAYGSTVVAQTVTLNGQPYAGGTLMQSGELVLRVTVTDSRGRTAGADYTLGVAAYTPPQLSLSAHRCTEDGTADDTGEYCQVTVRGSVYPLEGNAGTLTLSFAEAEEVTGEFSKTYLLEAPSTATLPLSATLSDALLSTVRDMVLSVGYATLDFLKGGRGIAFGTTATKEGFTCAMDARFLGSDLPLADYVVEQGVRGSWRYRKWNSGMAECWGSAVFSMETTDGYSSIMYFPAIFVGVPVITYSHGGASAFVQSCLANVAADHFQLRCTGNAGYHTNIPCYVHILGNYKEE